MKKIETGIEGLIVIEPQVFGDSRGYFFECWNKERFKEIGIDTIFVQDNESLSSYGVIRGLHYQLYPYSQAKLVRVTRGKVFDVAVDIRKNSPTFGKCFGIELSEENKLQMFIPRGFAHGFSVLSDQAVFSYKCDGVYNQQAERGINIYDKSLNIDWRVKSENAIVSGKDTQHPEMATAEMNFIL
ncbi:MAG: dTDP-4-dehydrorhamnose 3,5-epimerase [Bacteroidetes bacterium HGW-Bacteroidetes-21]|jgi:dTDP-4-dehydrorhamnose 3,5-epimerase|nr:MAG: dTDP-4-dehydrorhamnose 3,5-epimerase [Bacteroidetes bacterium HGW-Bacteroidetes-21]